MKIDFSFLICFFFSYNFFVWINSSNSPHFKFDIIRIEFNCFCFFLFLQNQRFFLPFYILQSLFHFRHWKLNLLISLEMRLKLPDFFRHLQLRQPENFLESFRGLCFLLSYLCLKLKFCFIDFNFNVRTFNEFIVLNDIVFIYKLSFIFFRFRIIFQNQILICKRRFAYKNFNLFSEQVT